MTGPKFYRPGKLAGDDDGPILEAQPIGYNSAYRANLIAERMREDQEPPSFLATADPLHGLNAGITEWIEAHRNTVLLTAGIAAVAALMFTAGKSAPAPRKRNGKGRKKKTARSKRQ